MIKLGGMVSMKSKFTDPLARKRGLMSRRIPLVPSPTRPSTTGFLLIDSSQNPVAFNPEAVQILCYPDKPADAGRLGEFLAGRIRSRLLNRAPHDYRSPFVSRFKSGRRLYFCRTFELTPTSEGSSPPTLGLLLERSSSEAMSRSEVAQQFHLSAREQEAVQFLLSGLTSKEIADRTKISPNTVKAFLRVVVIKMGVSRMPLNQEERESALIFWVTMVATAFLLYLIIRPFR
jgi:DNA-binding CsgD family transcriptional regulator